MKKLLSLLSASAMLLSAAAMPASAESTINYYEMVKGRDLDLNNDGYISDADFAIYYVYAFSFDDQGPDYVPSAEFDKLLENGDINNDGTIDGMDASIMYTVVSGGLNDYLPGDVNLDGVVNGTDATLALNCYTQLSAGVSKNEIPYHDLIKGYGDMDESGTVTGSDATMILNIYTELSTGK